jgi:putative Mg2+ transporter-C (MgtC) family protein
MPELGNVLEYFRELNFASTFLRLTMAMLFGGLIGLERERKRRAAGFRTYMLVCLGAALAMLLGQYEELMINTQWAGMLQGLGVKADVARFGAQVVNGIGFLGAGTIIVTARQEVKGLTTAAGLWASACTGLAIGAGFYEGVILAFIMIVLCIMVFPILEDLTVANGRNMNIYVEFERLDDITAIVRYIKDMNIQIFDVDVDREKTRGVQQRPNAILSLRLPVRQSHTAVLARIATVENICAIEEI